MGGGRRRRRSRQNSSAGVLLIVFGVMLVLGAGGGLTWYLVKKNRGKKGDADTAQAADAGAGPELKKALEETDKADPKWRLEDIVAARPKLDANKNGAALAMSVARMLPQNYGAAAEGFNTRSDPSQPISDFDSQRLRQVILANGRAVAEARKIAYSPQGRYAVEFNFQSPMDTPLPEHQESRKVAQLLLYDAELRAADRDGPGAMQSAYALLTLARYADEPILICQLVRLAEGALGIAALERAMTCANVPDDALAAAQNLLEAEGAANPLYTALRGERAMLHVVGAGGNKEGFKAGDAGRAWLLRTMNRAIALAAGEPPARSSSWSSIINDVRNGPDDAKRIIPAFDKVNDASARHAAATRSAAVALAAERYRRAKGDWPGDLKDLVPAYIKGLPTDPYTGGSLRYSKQSQGIAVYAVGPNPADRQGWFNSIGSELDKNSGFRLLNPNLRR